MNATTLGPRLVRAGPSQLDVERTGIRFWSPSPDRVRIEVEVHNRGYRRSKPTQLGLRAAAFGAFLPWKPLTAVAVPPIAPGASEVVATDVPRMRPPRRVLPRRVLEEQPDRRARHEARMEQIRQSFEPRAFMNLLLRLDGGPGVLPPDLYELLGDKRPHWAGNIEVNIGARRVERHVADFRMCPGRANVAVFALGGGDAPYVARIGGDALGWEHSLYNGIRRAWVHRADGVYRLGASRETAPLSFICRPPERCTRGTAEVRIQRQTDGDEAVVEFALDANGPRKLLRRLMLRQ